MALKQTEVLQAGSSIAVRPVNTPNTAPFEYFPLLNVKSVSGTFIENYGTAQDYNAGEGPAITRSHPYDDLAQITIYFIDENLTPIRFNLQDISNQPGWTPDEAGVAQATEDINSWVAIAVVGGPAPPPPALPSGAATELTLQSVLSAIQDGQDFESKTVVDATGTTYLEVRLWNSDTQTWEAPLYYAAGSNTGVPIGSLTAPVTYLNTQTTLSSILSELATLSAKFNTLGQKASADSAPVVLSTEQEVILNAIKTAVETLAADDAQIEVATVLTSSSTTGAGTIPPGSKAATIFIDGVGGVINGVTRPDGWSQTFEFNNDLLPLISYDGKGTATIYVDYLT